MKPTVNPQKARCHTEPRGDDGLEGFQLNEVYEVDAIHETNVYAIYLNGSLEAQKTLTIFNRYFELIKPIDKRKD